MPILFGEVMIDEAHARKTHKDTDNFSVNAEGA
jgi:hypothetical protein